MKVAFFLLLSIFFSGRIFPADTSAIKFHKIPVQDVFIGDVVYPQEKNEIQMTFKPSFRETSDKKTTTLSLLSEYGVTDQWQIELALDFYKWIDSAHEANTQGVGDLEIGTKYSFMNIKQSLYSLAIGFDLDLPVADVNQDLTEGFVEYGPYIILGKDYIGKFYAHLFSQLGLGFVTRTKIKHSDEEEHENIDPPANTFFWNGGVIFLEKNLHPVVEISWSTNKWNHHGNDESLLFTPGLIWNPKYPIELGIGVPINIISSTEHYRIIGLATVEFEA